MTRPEPKDYTNRTDFYQAILKYCDYLEKNQKKTTVKEK